MKTIPPPDRPVSFVHERKSVGEMVGSLSDGFSMVSPLYPCLYCLPSGHASSSDMYAQDDEVCGRMLISEVVSGTTTRATSCSVPRRDSQRRNDIIVSDGVESLASPSQVWRASSSAQALGCSSPRRHTIPYPAVSPVKPPVFSPSEAAHPLPLCVALLSVQHSPVLRRDIISTPRHATIGSSLTYVDCTPLPISSHNPLTLLLLSPLPPS